MTTTEEVIRLARESGFVLFDNATDEAITRFKCLVDLVRAEENEACAKVCEARSKRPNDGNWAAYEWDAICGTNELAAEEIRARKKV